MRELLRLSEYVDMIIPRGGNSLHTFCRENSTIPVITGGIGICHLYVDETADLDAAERFVHNAKVQRPSVCNALETLLVNQAIANRFVPRVIERLSQDGVEFRVDEQAAAVAPRAENVISAGPRLLSGWPDPGIRSRSDAAIEHPQHSTALGLASHVSGSGAVFERS